MDIFASEMGCDETKGTWRQSFYRSIGLRPIEPSLVLEPNYRVLGHPSSRYHRLLYGAPGPSSPAASSRIERANAVFGELAGEIGKEFCRVYGSDGVESAIGWIVDVWRRSWR